MSLALYGIANCDTVKKARAWLAAHELAYTFHDYKKSGVPAELLAQWTTALGWERLLNRQGSTWRKLTPEQQAAVNDDASARALMIAFPSVIRRPLVVEEAGAGKPSYQLGFDEAAWAKAFAQAARPLKR